MSVIGTIYENDIDDLEHLQEKKKMFHHPFNAT